MRVLLPFAFVAALLVGCGAPTQVAHDDGREGVYDLTTNRTATCELHGVTMTSKLVDLDFGMKPLSEMDKARPTLFPHADEPYDTGWCIPPRERHGRVFICAPCTQARTSWLSTNKIVQK